MIPFEYKLINIDTTPKNLIRDFSIEDPIEILNMYIDELEELIPQFEGEMFTPFTETRINAYVIDIVNAYKARYYLFEKCEIFVNFGMYTSIKPSISWIRDVYEKSGVIINDEY